MKNAVKVIASVMLAASLAVGLSGCGGGEGGEVSGVMDKAPGAGAASSGSDMPVVNWKMASTWGSGTTHYTCDTRFAEMVSILTDGRFTITNYGEGELCSSSQCFDYVQNGTVQAAGDCATYWVGKNPAFELLNSTVDDFSGMDYFLWINEADGMDIYNEVYGEYGMVYFPIACTWSESGLRSSKPITSLDDLRKMKVRMGTVTVGKAFEKLGISTVSVSGGELYESMQRGVIDACEFSTPYADDSLKLQEVAKYWCTPGWHQSAGVNGVMINKAAYDQLPDEYKEAISLAASITRAEKMGEYFWNDALVSKKMVEEEGVTVTHLDDDSMQQILDAYQECLEEEAAESPQMQKILDSMAAYRENVDFYRAQIGKYGFGFNKEDEAEDSQ